MNTKINPCEDFYKFVCGNYVNTTYNNSLDLIESRLHDSQNEVTTMYDSPIEENDHTSVKLVKRVYKACMNVSEIENDNLETLKEVLNTVGGGWPLLKGTEWNETQFNWLKATYTLRNLGYEFSIFLDLNVRSDPRNASRSIFQVRIPFDLDEATDSLSHKKSIIKRISLAFGANLGSATKELKKLYDFAEVITDQMLNHRGFTSYPIVTIAQLQKTISAINWLEYINTIAGPLVQASSEDSIVVVEGDSIIQRLNSLKTTSKRTQANYLMLKVIQETLPYLTPVMQDLLSEDDAKEPRSNFCQQEIEKRFLISPIDILYARKYAGKDKKEALELLIDRMRRVFIKKNEKSEWLSNEDRQNVQDKAEHLSVIVGEFGNYFDDSILNNLIGDLVEPENPNFLNLITALNKNSVSLNYAKVSRANNEKFSQKKSFVLPDIYYYPELNVLRVPTTQIKMLSFDKAEPEFLKYATVGKELGKEFSGLLKLSAGYFDKFGNKIVGWSRETSENYGKTSECLVNSMENIKKITFDFMLIEMQGSISGVKLAYDTFIEVAGHENGEGLEGVEYNSKQLFWISSVDCYPNNTEEYDLNNLPDTRDLPQSIVYAIVRNNPDFAKDFQCLDNSSMNPIKKCQLL
ncbi:hypothetical protein FQR65_LT06867 [Abscondita terminalis]|nr:hypothetical protein FQR65_LT06867 [Abscondita terminalis]